jgi:TrmH family RNA methyltransferase
MKHIASRDNPLFKRLRRLAQGKADSEGNQDGHSYSVLLEGIHLCQAWLDHRQPPELLVLDKTRLDQNTELHQLAARMPQQQVITLDSALATQLSEVGHGQGVYAVVRVLRPALPERIRKNCLWLDRIQDPGNVGTLLRTAAAAGIGQVFLAAGCAAAWSPKVLRSGQGAHFALEIHENLQLDTLCDRLDIPLVVTALDDQAVSLFDFSVPPNCAWVVGHEGQGVHPWLLARADHKVFIPQQKQVESLNVGVAAGICLFEQRRQMQQACD